MNILITGTSSGFGLLTTKTLAKKGHAVFAGMRGVKDKNASAASELRAWAEREGVTVHIVELDVADDASVDAGVKLVLDTAGRVDVVVNNAGAVLVGHVETFGVDQMEALFQVNVFGVHRVNRAVLPSMRAQGAGLLIHVSSTLGRTVLPALGMVSASKFAVEGMAEAYRYELAATGVESVILEPGPFPTGIGQKATAPRDADRAQGYGAAAELPGQVFAAMGPVLMGPNAPDPQLVADAILKLVETSPGQRPARTVVDPPFGKAAMAVNDATAAVQTQILEGIGLSSCLHPAASRAS